MLDIFLGLVDRLAKFAEVREKNREKFVDRYVVPLYNDAETIYRDYSLLLRDLQKKAARAKKIAPLLKYIEDKRQINLTTRTKVRALLKKRIDEKKLTRFEMGIFGLMTGSMTALDEGHCSFEPLHRGSHTILDVVKRLSFRGEKDFTADTRSAALGYIDRQIRGIDAAWSEVVSGYADFVGDMIPNSSPKVSKNKDLEGRRQ